MERTLSFVRRLSTVRGKARVMACGDWHLGSHTFDEAALDSNIKLCLKAHIWCEVCQKEITGIVMSNTEDAESFAQVDHKVNTGHWADGAVHFTQHEVVIAPIVPKKKCNSPKRA